MRSKRVAAITGLIIAFLLIGGAAIYATGSDPETWPVVYQDDFENPSRGWSVEETEQEAKAYVDGAYEIAVKEAHKWGTSCVPGMDFRDFTLEIDAKIQTESLGYLGVIYRRANWNNYYMFAISNKGNYTLGMMKDGKWTTLVNWTDISKSFRREGVNHLRLIAQGDTFSFFVNDKFVVKHTDDTLRGGEACLAVGAFAEPGLAIQFDNLVIRADPDAQRVLNKAHDLYAQAQDSYKHWKIHGALDLFQKALTLYKQINWKRRQADVMVWVGFSLYRLSSYREAITYYEEALSYYRGIGDRHDEVTALGNIGSCYFALSDYRKAIDYYEECLTIDHKIGNRNGEAYSLLGLGVCHAALGDYEGAIKYYEQALPLAREIQNRQYEGYTLGDLGSCYESLGDYNKAIDYHEQALKIFRAIGDRQGEANSLMGLGNCYEDLGDYKQAIDYYEQSLKIKREIGDRAGEAVSLNNLGSCYRSLGDYQQAIDHYEQALKIERAIGDRRGEANSLMGLGICYHSLGDYNKAIDYFEQSLAIAREIGTRSGELASLNGLGECYRKLGETDRAMAYYNQVLAIAQDIGTRLGEAAALDNLGNCYREKGQYDTALSYYTKSQEILQAIGHRAGQAEGLDDLAECYLDKGDYQQAINHYQQALTIAVDIGTVGTKWKAQWGLGKAYWKRGKLDSAKTYYEQAIAEVEGIRSRIKVDKLEQSYTASVHTLYEEYIELLLEMGKGQDTLTVDERARARAFLDALTASPAGLSKTAIEKGIEGGIVDKVKIARDVQATVAAAPEDMAILDYLVTNKGTNVWVIRGGKKYGPYTISHTRRELLEKIIKCRQEIESMTGVLPTRDLAELYDWLIRPVEKLLPSTTGGKDVPHLIIIPDGPLYYLPFQALIWTSQDRTERAFFIKRYAISYSFRLVDVSYGKAVREQTPSTSVFLGVANPNPDPGNPSLRLPDAAQEAYRVSACFPVAKVYTGEQANEKVIEKSNLAAQFLLFAAHGKFELNNPMYSYIALTPTKNTDGKLYAYEVYNLSLNINTVALSACETLLPAVKNLQQQMQAITGKTNTAPEALGMNQLVALTGGNELVSLTKAFLVAGASSVIASLWNVDSKAAAALMIAFHHHLEDDGMDKAQAFRAAQLDVMNTSDTIWSQPVFWAPFELIGNWQ